MNDKLTDIQRKIKELCIDRYHSPDDFVEFANKLMSLGVTRQTYDVLRNDLDFYSQNTVLYHLSVTDIDKSISQNFFNFGEALDVDRLKKAIENFDTKKISVVAFHQEVAQAGVVYVSVYLTKSTIYYLSQDGKYFLESY